MKILVLSDSHRETDYLRLAVKKENPDAVVHLGDHAWDADELEREYPILPLCRVKGNCDFGESRYPEKWLIHWEGVKLLAVHGHKQSVKSGLLQLKYTALEAGAQIVLFGHTHMPFCAEQDGLWMLNPGACGGRSPSYGLIEIQTGRVVSCCVKDLFLEEIL